MAAIALLRYELEVSTSPPILKTDRYRNPGGNSCLTPEAVICAAESKVAMRRIPNSQRYACAPRNAQRHTARPTEIRT